MAGIPAVLWRVAEGKVLPLTIHMAASCRYCGAKIDVVFTLRAMEGKPSRLRCPLCSARDMKVLSARALGGR
jgi:hypothetical protein